MAMATARPAETLQRELMPVRCPLTVEVKVMAEEIIFTAKFAGQTPNFTGPDKRV